MITINLVLLMGPDCHFKVIINPILLRQSPESLIISLINSKVNKLITLLVPGPGTYKVYCEFGDVSEVCKSQAKIDLNSSTKHNKTQDSLANAGHETTV